MDHLQILREAQRILEERGAVYGGVEQSFERAAQLASLKLDRVVTPYEVAIVLESVKDARRATNPFHFDSHLDGINYRAFAAEFRHTLFPDPEERDETDPVPAPPTQKEDWELTREEAIERAHKNVAEFVGPIKNPAA